MRPETLLDLTEDMMFVNTSLSVGCRNIMLLVSVERQSEKKLCEYFMLFVVSNGRGKTIIRDICNIIGVGCIITIIKEVQGRHNGCYNF